MKLLSAIKLFRQKDLSVLLAANIISTVGDFLTSLALPIYLYAAKSDPLVLAISYIAYYLPKFPVQLFAGVYVDKKNSCKIFVWGNFLSFLFTMGYVYIIGTGSMALLYLNVFIVSSINTFVGISSSTMLTKMTDKKEYPLALNVFTMVYSIAAMLIPPLGTVVLLKWGVKPMFFGDAISFLVAGVLVMGTISSQKFSSDLPEGSGNPFDGLWTEIRQGYLLVLDKSIIKMAFLLLFFGGLVGRFLDVLTVFILQDKFRLGMELGNFMGIRGVGSLAGSLLILQFLGKDMFKSFVKIHFFAIASLLFFVLPSNLLLAYFGMFAFGFFTIGISLAVRNILNANSERSDMGKMFSLFRVVVTLSSIIPLLIVDGMRRVLGSASNALLAAVLVCLVIDACLFVFSGRYETKVAEEV